MTYILYGDDGSGAAPVEMALAEAGRPVERRPMPYTEASRRADYLRINPMGRVPALLLPDGTVLTETLAILVTLADRHPGLLPPPGETGRAVALRWMAVAAAEFYPHVTRADFPERFGAVDPEALRARAVEMGRETWRVVEAHAGLRGPGPEPFLLGARFSVADIYLAVLSRWLGGRAWVPAHCPRIEALAQAVAARPAIAPLWRRHGLAG